MIYDNVGGIRDPLKQDLTIEFCRKEPRDISIITETHINHDQIYHQIHIRNNCFGPIFFSPGDNHTERLLVLLHLGLDTEADTNPKWEFVSFTVTPHPLMSEFSVLLSLQGIAPGNSWLGEGSLKNYKIVWKIKMRETKTKKYLETLTELWIKWIGIVEMKYKDFIDAVPIIPSLWIMDLRIYGEGIPQISLS